MQTCYNCGKQVPDTTLICPDCGALVRRYTDAPPREQPNQQPLNPFPQTPAQPTDPGGKPLKVRLYGGVRVWLIILIILSVYMAFSSLMSVFLAANPALLDAMMAGDGMETMEPMINMLREIMAQPLALPMFSIMAAFYAAKCACHLWLLLSGRRLPFRISIGVSMAGLLAVLLLGGGLLAIIYFLDPLFTWLGLRRFWPWMPK